MRWSYFEEILLFYVYTLTLRRGEKECVQIIERLSRCLREYYASPNSDMSLIDSTLRSENEIRDKLDHLRFAATEGMSGQAPCSQLEMDIYKMSCEQPEHFRDEVAKAKQMFNFDVINSPTVKDPDDVKEGRTLAQKYGVNAELFKSVKIDELCFPVRATNRLRREGCRTIADVLSMRESDLYQLSGLGVKTYAEIDVKLSEFCDSERNDEISIDNNSPEQHMAQVRITPTLREHADEICVGDFSWCTGNVGNDINESTIEALTIAQENLGTELACNAVANAPEIINLIAMFDTFIKQSKKDKKHFKVLEAEVQEIPECRRTSTAQRYIRAYTSAEQLTQSLKSIITTEDTFITLSHKSNLSHSEFDIVSKFLKWAKYDLKEELQEFVHTLFVKPRDERIISMRAHGETLEATGQQVNLTRERVRQIEVKVKRKFQSSQSRGHYLTKIALAAGNLDVITVEDLDEFLGDKSESIFYLLRMTNNPAYFYDEHMEALILGDNSTEAEIQEYVESLPELFNESKLLSFAEEAAEKYDIPKELVTYAIKDTYNLTGTTYHRSRLSLSAMYVAVLEKYYQEGIRAYDDNELATFRCHVLDTFGEVKLPNNNRAISARLADIGILCGRGMYRPKKNHYITQNLLKRIEEYIDTNPSDLFLINTIFYVFEDELVAEGVDNKYYLQGILHNKFGEKYYFKRDYLSKTPNVTSMYDEIVSYIKASQYPVSKEEIQKAYPGITDIVLNLAIMDNRVLNFFGEYLHVAHLNISSDEKSWLYTAVREVVEDQDAHHIKDIYSYVEARQPNILSKNAIRWPFSLFSVLAYLFSNQFNFERPYVALNGISIEHPYDQIKEYVLSNDVVQVSDIMEIAKEKHYNINSILELCNSFDDTHLMMNSHSLIAITNIGITPEKVSLIENMILNEICGCIPFSWLKCLHALPPISVPWSEWLLYGIIRKWSKKLDVAVSNNQLRLAMPLVAPSGTITKTDLEKYCDSTQDIMENTDNLDNIDDLISDCIEDEMKGWDDF